MLAMSLGISLGLSSATRASILYTSSTPVTVTNSSSAISTGLSRDDTSTDTLYFSFTIDPTSDYNDENYFGGLELYNAASQNTVSIGNNWNAHAWSVYGTSTSEEDLNSANNEPGQSHQLVDATDGPVHLVARIDYAAGGNDTLTVYLNPPTVAESSQPASLTTTLTGDFGFNSMQFRVGNDGKSWTMNDLTISTTYGPAVPEASATSALALGLAVVLVRLRARRK